MTHHVHTTRALWVRTNMLYAIDKNRRTLAKFSRGARIADIVNANMEAYRDAVTTGAGTVRMRFDPGSQEMTVMHITPSEPACDHEWNNGGENPTHCVKCGYSFERYVHGMF